MIKKTLILLAVAVLSAWSGLLAQQINGRWTIYPTVGDGFSKVVEGTSGVYTLTGNTLSRHDFGDNSNTIYNTDNGLSENGIISGLYYNYDKNYLAVTYSNGNIDLIYDDGRVINMPEIRDAVLSAGHGINNINFEGDRMYVATEFGFVVYNDERHEVVESGIFNTNFGNAFHVLDNVVLHCVTNSNKNIYSAPDKAAHTNLSNFKTLGGLFKDVTCKLGDNLVFWHSSGTKAIYRMAFTKDADGTLLMKQTQLYGVVALVCDVMGMKGGMFAATADKYLFFKPDLSVEEVAIPEALKGGKILATTGPASMWVEINGVLGRYDVSGATPRQLMTIVRPEGTTVAQPVHFRWSRDGSKLYIANTCANFNYETPGDNMEQPVYVDVLEDGVFTDVAVHNAARYASTIPDFNYDRNTGRLGGTQNIAVDPDDPTIHYESNNNLGIAMVQDNDIKAVSNKTNNSTPTYWWLNRTMGVDIDKDGNMWMLVGYATDADAPTIGVLPAAKRRSLGTAKKSDWVNFTHDRILGAGEAQFTRDARIMLCEQSPMKFFILGQQETGFLAINDNGTPLNTSDDIYEHYTYVTDTDGNSIQLIFCYDMAEDHNGALWVGMDRGVFYIDNPTDASNSSTLRVKRPIVPRNDGTQYGDYLLETERVYTVAVDPSNRKWLGTYSSGVYLVSEDGKRILAHYTAENSPLPSNWVYRITCDPNSNKVYFATNNGLAAFDSDSSPAAEDFSNVYAYPNPVRPEYTGWITIAGLMEDSLVKIADIAGNVFFTARSEGGMVSWDGCDSTGRRVKTGVYLVFASQNASGSSSGAVAKIMVVN